jgi:hypothetical protein
MAKRRHKGAGLARGLLSRAIPLVGESHALSYELVDALCQVAYELQEKLTKALEMFQEIEKVTDP